MLLGFAAGKISSIIIRLTYNALADETYRDFLQRIPGPIMQCVGSIMVSLSPGRRWKKKRTPKSLYLLEKLRKAERIFPEY